MRYLTILLICSGLFFSGTGICLANNFENDLNAIETILKKQVSDEYEIRDVVSDLNTIKLNLGEAITQIQTEIDEIKLQLENIGEPIKGEDPDVSQKRVSLTQKSSDLEKRNSQYQVMLLQLQDYLSKATALHKRLLAARLLSRGPTISTLYRDVTVDYTNPLPVFVHYLRDYNGLDLYSRNDLLLCALFSVLAIFMGIRLRSRIRHWVSTHKWSEDYSDRFLETSLLTSARYAPWFAGLLVPAIYSFIQPPQVVTPFINLVFLSVPVFLCLLCVIECLFYPRQPARLFIEMPRETGKSLATSFRIFLTLSLTGFLFSFTLYALGAPEPAIYLTRDSLSIAIILNLFWLAIITRKLTLPHFVHTLRNVIMLVLAATLIIELTGYRNLAFFTLRSLLSITLAIGLFLLFKRLIHEIFTALDEGTKSWHIPIRTAFGLRQGEHIPGLTSFMFFSLLGLWLGLFYIILRVLGFSDTIIQSIHESFVNGFTIGSLQVNPAKLMIAMIVFASLFTLSGWLKVRLEKKWLLRTRIERGSREAIVTMVGYVGIAIAALVALGIAGFTFTNVAIVAGALSVGIGFGLQNIVNNFVSGLILLFERPIKKGDWIVVGATEGYVKKISIRSTQIQTFDRADVIIPNSDLISNQLTNWMLHDQHGRIRIPFGIAYGSDTELVKNIVLDIANANQNVIKNQPDYRMRVLFLNFGDSALNFELRCHIQNIDERMQVTSDINFALDKAFRENNISIPFPQRDLHIKEWPAGNNGTPAKET